MTDHTPSPRGEYPNPVDLRPYWLGLNGPWKFSLDPRNEGEFQHWWHQSRLSAADTPPFDRTITVPFPWESRLSGIAERSYSGVAWYRRTITLPPGWHERGLHPHLHFGAVDWEARLWVNGRLAGEHTGGYSSFSFNLASFVTSSDELLTLTLRVRDNTEAAALTGKQVPNWYTYSSGIWQPVWLDARPADHLVRLDLRPSLAGASITATAILHISHPGAFTLTVSSPDAAFPSVRQQLTLTAGVHASPVALTIFHPHAWSPDDPHLYRISATLTGPNGTADTLESYTGLRDIATAAWDGRPYQYILLNGEPLYLRGALDQAFHPDGIYAYPSDEVIRNDIASAKAAGLNFLRCHIKINDPRYYYWADRLGLLIMQDVPNPSLSTPASRRSWEDCLRSTLERDGNHPSIFSWVLFNETWGLTEHDSPASWEWLSSWVTKTKELDPTRLVEDNSPCNWDHVRTDINSWHFYINDWRQAREHIAHVVAHTYSGSPFNYIASRSSAPEAQRYRQGNEPLINSEYAGISARSGDRDISQSLKYLTTLLRAHDKICGYVYTELTDVEWEHNGLLEYDRLPKSFGYDAFVEGMSLADILGPDVVGCDAPPIQTCAPGTTIQLPFFISHWSGRDLTDCQLHWRLELTDRFGRHFVVRDGMLTPTVQRYTVTTLPPLNLSLPEAAGLATLTLRLISASGTVLTRNYVNFEIFSAPAPRAERCPSGWLVRCAPADVLSSSWPLPRSTLGGEQIIAAGRCHVDYHFPWPAGVGAGRVKGLRLQLELATAAAQERSTPWGGKQPGIPQTEPQHTMPGAVAISLGDVPLGTVELPDDPNDARGILSFLRSNGEHSSYGTLVQVPVPSSALPAVLTRAHEANALQLTLSTLDVARARGFTLYGERAGAYPVDPMLFIDLEDQV